MDLQLILLTALIIIVCLLASRLSLKFGMPTLLIFMLLGMLFGVDGIFGVDFSDFAMAEAICSFALIFIMFYGGFGTNWKESRPVATKSFLLSTLGVVLTAAITAAFCRFVMGFDTLNSLLIGSVISSTDAASVFSILKQKKLDLKENTSSLLALESGSNDPASYMLTVLVLTLMSSPENGLAQLPLLILTQIAFAVIFGALFAVLTIFVLKSVRFAADGFDTIFVLVAAIAAYALPAMLNGNGYLSVYLFGIILGNSTIKNKVTLVHFFDGVTGLAQIVIFFLLGLLVTPSNLPAVLLPAVAIFLFMSVVSRPAAVFGIMGVGKKGARSSVRQMLLVSWSGLRGASSIVFAIMAVVGGANTDVFDMVFCMCLISVALQGSLLPTVAKKLDMVNARGHRLKTFNDYQGNAEMQLMSLNIPEGHPWVGKTVRELTGLVDTLIVVIKRGEDSIVPKGNTRIYAGDKIVLCGEVYNENDGVRLTEQEITPAHEWRDKLISEINIPQNVLIVGVRRKQGKTIIPRGNTALRAGDTVIMCKGDFVEDLTRGDVSADGEKA